MSVPSPTQEATLSLRPSGAFASEPVSVSSKSLPSLLASNATGTRWTGPGDRYQFREILARGGMGVIWRVHDRVLGRDLALKVLRPELQGRPEMVLRFLEEAQIGGQLQHPGIVPVHELGQLSPGGESSPSPYFTMKLIQGKTLGEILTARSGPAAERGSLLSVFQQVCQTLAFAHARGVIHRDLKPSNIMVGDFGEVLVMDWGVAKLLRCSESQTAHTEVLDEPLNRPDTGRGSSLVGSVVGTPGYMAPEQARGDTEQLDERCDVFGLGAILCEILTGEPPYRGYDTTTMEQVKRGNLDQALERLATSKAEPDLIALARQCLSPERDARPRNAGAVAEAVQHHLNTVEERLHQAELTAERDREKRQQERKGRRWKLALAATVIAMLVVGGGTWAYQRQERSNRQARINQEVQQHLAEASRLWGEARKQPPTEVEKWLEAVAAVQQARASLASGEADVELKQHVEGLLTAVQAEADVARSRADELRRDRKMLHDLEEANLRTTDVQDDTFATHAGDPLYDVAFRNYGVPVFDLAPAEVAARLRGRAIEAELLQALYAWLRGVEDPKRAQRILAVLDYLDSDNWRNSFRKAFSEHNASELRRLATVVDVKAEPLTILLQLSLILSGSDWSGDTEAAASLLRRLQKQYPSDFWVNHHLGATLNFSTPPRSEEAIGYFRAAVAIRPQSPGLYLNLANAFSKLGREEEAREALEKALELKPDYAMAHHGIGNYHFRRNDYARASAAYKNAIKYRDKEPLFYESLGRVYQIQKDWPQAIATYQKAIQINPYAVVFPYRLGETYQQQGNWTAAQQSLEQALRLNPRFAPAYRVLSNLAASKGDRLQALAHSKTAVQCDPGDAENWRFLGWAANRAGFIEQAEQAWRRAVELYPRDPECAYWLGGLLHERWLLEDALRYYEQACTLKPQQPEYHCNLGLTLFWRGDFARALRELKLGHELGSQREGWSYPSAIWVRRTERLLELDPRLRGVLNGTDAPKTPIEEIEFAVLAGIRGAHHAAVRFYVAAFKVRTPKGDQRTMAAASAVLAASGPTQDVVPVAEKDHAALRLLALDWLREELQECQRLARQSESGSAEALVQTLSSWQFDVRLKTVRLPASLAVLPEKERADWKQFWADVVKLEQQLRKTIEQTEKGSR